MVIHPPETRSGARLPRRDSLCLAVIAEDLRQPWDEGAKKAVLSLIRSLGNQGVRTVTFTRYEDGGLKDALQLPRNKLLLGRRFGHDLRAKRPDLILYAPASSGTVGALFRAAMIKAQSSGIPIVVLSLQYRRLPAFVKYLGLGRYIEMVLTLSRASTDTFRSLGIETVQFPGAVDTSIFKPVSRWQKEQLRRQYGYHADDRIVLHVGHCNRNRNVSAVARCAREGLKAILVASTSTPVDADLMAELRQAGVQVIAESIEEVEHLYQLADCYLFPVSNPTSAIDAPLSVLEAMACNLPIVSTQFGALPEMFPPGSGFYYADSDDEMSRRVAEALANPDCRTAEMISSYSWNNVASNILEKLRDVARRGKKMHG